MFERHKIGNIHQVGGIETSICDNGPARGTRMAWVNTGSGLRYKVVPDRGMDIVEAFYNEHSLVWLSHNGLTAARPDAYRGIEWLRTFAGGLLTTCGLSHIGPPEGEGFEERGVHGRVSNLVADVESVKQAELEGDNGEMSITGHVRESKVFGPWLHLKRTIRSRLGEAVIVVEDTVRNEGNTPQPHMLLYHCNFGWPVVDEGTEIVYDGHCRSRGMAMDDELFNEKRNAKRAPGIRDSHSGGGESCGFIDMRGDEKGNCLVGLINHELEVGVAMTYPYEVLPCLTNWQHWGEGEYVCGLEPGTNFPIGQEGARKEGSLIMLEPGASRSYRLEIRVLDGRDELASFFRSTGPRD